MTSRDFCYWLQGFFEINGLENDVVTISDKQSAIIQAHLNLVFKHEIDPDNFKGKSSEQIKEYGEIHKGARSSTSFLDDSETTFSFGHKSLDGTEATFNC